MINDILLGFNKLLAWCGLIFLVLLILPYEWSVYLLLYLSMANLIGYLVFYMDKRQAIQSKRRVPEWGLLVVSLLGLHGGALLGMILHRHKVVKSTFLLKLLLTCGVSTGLIIWSFTTMY